MNLRIPLVDLIAQYRSIREEIVQVTSEVLESGIFVLGPQLEAFEREFARYSGARWGVGVGSGTDALILSLRALGIGQGDEVITTSNTFISTANAIVAVGARPFFVDIDPSIYTINPAKIARVINNRTRAIIPVHMFGHPADMDPIIELADKYGLAVVEDACQSHGAEYKGRKVGSLGLLSCFSYYPSKNLGAYGDGGMILTDDPDIAGKIRMLRNYGQREKYNHLMLGTNSRLDELQAAILRVKLRHLEDWIEARRKLAEEYRRSLDGVDGVIYPIERDYARHVFYLYVIRQKRRDRIADVLKKAGIETGIHYPIPIHQQKAFADISIGITDLKNTEEVSRELLSLPMYPEIPVEGVQRIADLIRRAIVES